MGVFIGVLLGLALAAAVAYVLLKSPSPFKSSVTDTAGSMHDSGGGEVGKSDAAATEKPRFDFYKILPGKEEAKPAAPELPVAKGLAAAPAPNAGAAKPSELYYVQAGSYQNQAEADGQKAKLALLGMEASVQTVVLPDKGTWYRVRLGPYDNADEMNRSRAELAKRGFDASVIRSP